jgi:hypothetical protein
VSAKAADFANVAAPAPKQILASMLIALPPQRSATKSLAKVTKVGDCAKAVMAFAPIAKQAELSRGPNAPKVIPAKASLSKQLNHKQLTQPAVLIFWQETYEDGYGNVIQRSYWRVVVLPTVPDISKQQPKRI